MKIARHLRKNIFTILIISALLPAPSFGEWNPKAIPGEFDDWWTEQPKENKLFYTNIAAATVIGLWGLSEWGYGSAEWNNANEGWFQHDTKYGGADKLGHFWATYAFSDALTGLYKHWGYESNTANLYGAISAWSVQAFMEIADATSETQGFSWQDMVMNSLGALTSVFLERYPAIDRVIDFRVEYVFNQPANGIFDDYNNHFYSIVVKLDGFDSIEHEFLQILEFHAGYYTRGYGDKDRDNVRSMYAGISFNFSKFFHTYGYHKTGKTLEYLQLPYTVPKLNYDLD